MRGVVALAAALLLSLAMSGCFVAKDDPETQATDDAGSSTGSTSQTGTAGGTKPGSAKSTSTAVGNTTNGAPSANLTASALNGTAPLNVTFTASGVDPEDGALTWTLTEGNTTLGNGTALPANVTQVLEAGNHTIVLTVSDGRSNTTANVTVVVIAGEVEPPTGSSHEDDWAVFNADGTCDAKGEIDLFGEYIHERGDPPGTGYVAGGGTWIYEEANDIDGLQIGGPGEDAAYKACVNPDFLVF